MTRVAVVRFGRGRALGEERRAATWTSLIRAAGHEPVELSLLPAGGPSVASVRPGAVLSVAVGSAVPESLAWTRAGLSRWLAREGIDVQIAVTTRATATRPVGGVPTIVDLVDDLADSYARRGRLSRSPAHRAAWAALARSHTVVQRRLRSSGVHLVAAGHADAVALGARWVPNVVDLAEDPWVVGRPGSADLLFFGNLSYGPNVEALDDLASAWPEISALRPGTSLRIAGRYLGAELEATARRCGWEVEPDFPSVEDLCRRAALGVAPLSTANGIQNKVLEGAATGLPQLYTPAVAAGFGPHQPGRTVALADLPRVVTTLLDDAAALQELGRHGRTVITDHFTATAWATEVDDLIRSAAG